MKKMLKWLGIIIGVIVALLITLVGGLYFTGNSRLAQAEAVTVAMIDIPTDETALARGQQIADAISLCSDCHAEGLKGQVYVDEAPIGVIPAPNLTSGAGGVGGTYTDEDWIRAIRHGIGQDGRTLAIMPSNAYAHLSDSDLGALIAYLKSVPPVDNELPDRELMVLGTIIFGGLAYGDMPVSLIDHDAVQSVSGPAEDISPEYGDYLLSVGACRDCHGAQLAGRLEGSEGPPLGPNLTPGGNLTTWSEADFIQTIRFGNTPEGVTLDPVEMPWPWYANMTDDELKAIWLHLESLPARELGEN